MTAVLIAGTLLLAALAVAWSAALYARRPEHANPILVFLSSTALLLALLVLLRVGPGAEAALRERTGEGNLPNLAVGALSVLCCASMTHYAAKTTLYLAPKGHKPPKWAAQHHKLTAVAVVAAMIVLHIAGPLSDAPPGNLARHSTSHPATVLYWALLLGYVTRCSAALILFAKERLGRSRGQNLAAYPMLAAGLTGIAIVAHKITTLVDSQHDWTLWSTQNATRVDAALFALLGVAASLIPTIEPLARRARHAHATRREAHPR